MVDLSVIAVALLLGCCVRAWDFNNCCSCPVVRCVPAGRRVFVPCPSPALAANAEVSFQLNNSMKTVASYYFDGLKCNTSVIGAGLEYNVTRADRWTEIHLNNTATDGWAQFAIPGVTVEDSGLYRCSTKVLHPGPVVTHCSGPTVNLLLEGPQCPVVRSPPDYRQCDGLWIWIGGTVVLVVYAVLITIVASVKIVRIKTDKSSQSEYMNTKHMPR